jgi:hypothetical protein
MGVIESGLTRYVAINDTDFAIAGGADGWIDTDISAVVPSLARAVSILCWCLANEAMGGRAPGSTALPLVWTFSADIVCECANSRIEFYRSTNNRWYKVLGYFV